MMLADMVLASLIAAVGPIASTVVGIVLKRLIDKTNRHLETVKEGVADIKLQTNGISSALVKVTGEAEKAKGNLEGRKELKAEIKEDKLLNKPDDSCRFVPPLTIDKTSGKK